MARNTPTPVKPKVALVTLGCPKNLVDSEMMLGYLDKEGFELCSSPKGSDVIVVNTCGFIDKSKAESINKLLELAEYKKTGDAKVLVAAGCLTQRYVKELELEMPEVDLFLGTGEFSKIGSLLKDHMVKNKIIARSFVSEKQILPDSSQPRILSTPQHYAYVKISEGCNHRCSFCIIPHIRGNLTSRTIENICEEIKLSYKKGVREFNLIGQDLNEYGFDLLNDSKLATLIEAIDKIPGKFWVRLNYMYPLEFSSQLIEAIARSEKVVPYIDMPLQHISDRILMSMRRGSGSRYVRQLIKKLKSTIPDLKIRTSFIVGYPGETEEEFEELLDFIREARFDHLGAFKYSPEEGTTAAALPGRIPEEVMEERYDRLMRVQQGISKKLHEDKIGQEFELIFEGASEEHEWVLEGRLPFQAPEIDGVTYLSDCNVHEYQPGDFIQVRITEGHEYDLVAVPVK